MKELILIMIVLVFVSCDDTVESETGEKSTDNFNKKIALKDSINFHIRKADSLLNLSMDLDLTDKIDAAKYLLEGGEGIIENTNSLFESIDSNNKILDSIRRLENVNNDSLLLDFLMKTEDVHKFKFDKIDRKALVPSSDN